MSVHKDFFTRVVYAPLLRGFTATKRQKYGKRNSQKHIVNQHHHQRKHPTPLPFFAIATLAAFAGSALLHEYVILTFFFNEPTRFENTTFFMMNGLLVIAQEAMQRYTGFGRSWGKGSVTWDLLGWCGFFFSMIMTSPLFMGPFVRSGWC
jgi:hypothetical protein